MEKLSLGETILNLNQKQKKKQKELGTIVCCGNYVFRVINGQRHWISEPPKDWETIDGRVWNS